MKQHLAIIKVAVHLNMHALNMRPAEILRGFPLLILCTIVSIAILLQYKSFIASVHPIIYHYKGLDGSRTAYSGRGRLQAGGAKCTTSE